MADARPWRPSPLITASAGLHALAAASLVAAPSQWPWALGLVACDHVALTVAGLIPRWSLLGPNVLRLAPSAQPRVALTFDDGPWPVSTMAIVRTLTETKGRVGGHNGAAARLGLNRTTLLSRMKKMGLKRPGS